MARLLKNSGSAQESANRSSCTYVLDHKGKSVGSELIETPQRERTIVGQSSLGSARLQRWFSWAEAWKGSPHPLANEMLTVLLPRAELDDWIARGGTIGSYRKRILDEVRRPIATHGYPWLAMYVTEVRNTPHFHALLWLPLATTIREEVAKWFIRRFGCRLKDRASSYFESLRPSRR